MTSPALYTSTRGRTRGVSFCEAALMGLATDGGLLLPEALPDVRGELSGWRELSYGALAEAVMRPFVGDGLSAATLSRLVSASYASFSHPEICPLQPVGPVHIMELFHGPTLAFKDVALQFLGQLFEEILGRSGAELNLLGATSGDTGSAAIAGVRGKAGIRIVVMHPHGRVSPIQERQMTTVLDDNVHNLAITGTFDDGQRVLKEIFNDLAFRERYHLGAVNSVNWVRVLAQMVYYFHAAFRMQERCGCERIQVCVPTGNFGDVFAGYLARRMGAPISRLVVATNENDILARFFATGVYARGEVRQTSSPSMDIQVASNFERYLYYRLGGDSEALVALLDGFARTGQLSLPGRDDDFAAGRASVGETAEAIRDTYRRHGYLLDPHTAVGVAVGQRFLRPDEPMVCLATAHPAKFPDAIREALGEDLARHPAIDGLRELPTRCTVIPATREAVQEFMRCHLA
ncbi:MAG: threonine synthase [Lentisphaerae bacterium]|nr:threonine synthase [Lentisphaerota bacterium]